MPTKPLAAKLNIASTKAFRVTSNLAEMSVEERETAACFYEHIAQQACGSQVELARRYNLERARFLRGEVPRMAVDAVEFAKEIGYIEK